MRRRTATWLSGLGAMVLIGIPVLALAESWDKNFPSSGRLQTLATFHNQAVLDKNTGLVWEQAPDTGFKNWYQSLYNCVDNNVGGTRGWRLPSLPELASLIDSTLAVPFVPANIFIGVQTGAPYWAATTNVVTSNVWIVDFSNGFVGEAGRDTPLHVWCVRGPMQESVY